MLNHDKIKFLLSKEKWIKWYESNSVSECIFIIQNIIKNILNDSFTSKSVNSKN